MRAIHVISLCGLLVLVGLVLTFGRRLTAPVEPATTESTSSALTPALPPQAPSPQLSPLPIPNQHAASTTPATAGLACIQNALGGVQVFAGVTSLRIVGNTKPTAPLTGWHPVANRREIGVVFPDRYRQSNVQTDAPAGSAPLTSLGGFNGDELLSAFGFAQRPSPRLPDDAVPKAMHGARLGFVREMLVRLPRELAGVHLSQRTTLDAGQERLAIDASGLDGLDVTLLADPRTCMPVAVQYIAPSQTGQATFRVDLSEYRRFGGILFATVLKTTKDGAPEEDEYVSEVQVNAPLGDKYFRVSGG